MFERPLMCLVQNDRVVLVQVTIGLSLGQQNAVGHQFHVRLGARVGR